MYICIFSGTFGRGTSRMVNIAQNSAGAGYTGSKFLSVGWLFLLQYVSVKYNTPKYKKYQARRGESDTFIVFIFYAYAFSVHLKNRYRCSAPDETESLRIAFASYPMTAQTGICTSAAVSSMRLLLPSSSP